MKSQIKKELRRVTIEASQIEGGFNNLRVGTIEAEIADVSLSAVDDVNILLNTEGALGTKQVIIRDNNSTIATIDRSGIDLLTVGATPTFKVDGTTISSGGGTTDASDLTSGTLADARLSTNVPLLDSNGELNSSTIPNFSAVKITSGTLTNDRLSGLVPIMNSSFGSNDPNPKINVNNIPNLDASKLTSGTIASSRLSLTESDIPTLAQNKITNLTSDLAAKLTSSSTLNADNLGSGTIPSARIPTLAQDKVSNLTTDLSALTAKTATLTVSASSPDSTTLADNVLEFDASDSGGVNGVIRLKQNSNEIANIQSDGFHLVGGDIHLDSDTVLKFGTNEIGFDEDDLILPTNGKIKFGSATPRQIDASDINGLQTSLDGKASILTPGANTFLDDGIVVAADNIINQDKDNNTVTLPLNVIPQYNKHNGTADTLQNILDEKIVAGSGTNGLNNQTSFGSQASAVNIGRNDNSDVSFVTLGSDKIRIGGSAGPTGNQCIVNDAFSSDPNFRTSVAYTNKRRLYVKGQMEIHGVAADNEQSELHFSGNTTSKIQMGNTVVVTDGEPSNLPSSGSDATQRDDDFHLHIGPTAQFVHLGAHAAFTSNSGLPDNIDLGNTIEPSVTLIGEHRHTELSGGNSGSIRTAINQLSSQHRLYVQGDTHIAGSLRVAETIHGSELHFVGNTTSKIQIGDAVVISDGVDNSTDLVTSAFQSDKHIHLGQNAQFTYVGCHTGVAQSNDLLTGSNECGVTLIGEHRESEVSSNTGVSRAINKMGSRHRLFNQGDAYINGTIFTRFPIMFENITNIDEATQSPLFQARITNTAQGDLASTPAQLQTFQIYITENKFLVEGDLNDNNKEGRLCYFRPESQSPYVSVDPNVANTSNDDDRDHVTFNHNGLYMIDACFGFHQQQTATNSNTNTNGRVEIKMRMEFNDNGTNDNSYGRQAAYVTRGTPGGGLDAEEGSIQLHDAVHITNYQNSYVRFYITGDIQQGGIRCLGAATKLRILKVG